MLLQMVAKVPSDTLFCFLRDKPIRFPSHSTPVSQVMGIETAALLRMSRKRCRMVAMMVMINPRM